MEKLQIKGACHRTVRRAGNVVLHAAFPTVTGDTYAAKYAERLLETLWDFTQNTLVPQAETALLTAAKTGNLFAFHPHTFTITLEKKEAKQNLKNIHCSRGQIHM